MSDKKEEKFVSYVIPYNFIDESKVFGGTIKTRSLIEGIILSVICGFPLLFIRIPNLVIMVFVGALMLIPPLVLGVVGINEEPISSFIFQAVIFRRKKRIVSFNSKIKFHERMDLENLEETELPRDKVLKIINNLGLKRESMEGEDDLNSDFVFDDDLNEIKKREEEMKKSIKGKSSKESFDDIEDILNEIKSVEAETINHNYVDDEDYIENDDDYTEEYKNNDKYDNENIEEYETYIEDEINEDVKFPEIEDEETIEITGTIEINESDIESQVIEEIDDGVLYGDVILDKVDKVENTENLNIIDEFSVIDDIEEVVIDTEKIEEVKTKEEKNTSKNNLNNIDILLKDLQNNKNKTQNIKKQDIKKQDIEKQSWICPQCGNNNDSRFCSDCGYQRTKNI